MADETPDLGDDLLDEEPPATAGSSGFARIVEAVLATPEPPRRRGGGRRVPAITQEPGDETPAAALDRAQELVRGGQVDAGLTLCHRVWPVVAEAGDVALMGICQAALLLGYHYKGMCRAAVAAGRLGLTLMDRNGDLTRKVHLMSNLAANLARIGQSTEAFEVLYRGAQLLPSTEADPLTQCRFWSNAAATYCSLELHEDALACALKGAELAELIDDASMVTVARCNVVLGRLAVLRHRRAGWPEIEPVHRELLEWVDEAVSGGRQHLVLAMAVTGADALMSVQRWDEARSLLHAGRSATLAAGMGPAIAHIELRLAAVARMCGQLRLASVHAREAVMLAMQQEDAGLRAEACLESSLVYEAQGHWQHALTAFRDYVREKEAWHAAQATSQWRALAHRVNQERDRPSASFDADLGAAAGEPAGALGEPAGASGARASTRESFEQRLEGWRRWRSSDGPLVVMIGGVDALADLRVRFGRECALEASRRLGGLLATNLRPGDQLCAWDDEHHAVAFHLGTALASALEIGHRLCTLAGHLDWGDIAPGFAVSASFGLAVFGTSEDLETASLRAAWALHDVRRDGRGRARAIW